MVDICETIVQFKKRCNFDQLTKNTATAGVACVQLSNQIAAYHEESALRIARSNVRVGGCHLLPPEFLQNKNIISPAKMPEMLMQLNILQLTGTQREYPFPSTSTTAHRRRKERGLNSWSSSPRSDSVTTAHSSTAFASSQEDQEEVDSQDLGILPVSAYIAPVAPTQDHVRAATKTEALPARVDEESAGPEKVVMFDTEMPLSELQPVQLGKDADCQLMSTAHIHDDNELEEQLGTPLWRYLRFQVPEALELLNQTKIRLKDGIGRSAEVVSGVFVLKPEMQCVMDSVAQPAMMAPTTHTSLDSKESLKSQKHHVTGVPEDEEFQNTTVCLDIKAITHAYRLADSCVLLRVTNNHHDSVIAFLEDSKAKEYFFEVAIAVADFNANVNDQARVKTGKSRRFSLLPDVPFAITRLEEFKLSVQVNLKNAQGQKRRPLKFGFIDNVQVEKFMDLSSTLRECNTIVGLHSQRSIKEDCAAALKELSGDVGAVVARYTADQPWTLMDVCLETLLLTRSKIVDDPRVSEPSTPSDMRASATLSSRGTPSGSLASYQSALNEDAEADRRRIASANNRRHRMQGRATSATEPRGGVGFEIMRLDLCSITNVVRADKILKLTLGKGRAAELRPSPETLPLFAEICASIVEANAGELRGSLRVIDRGPREGVAVFVEGSDEPTVFKFRTPQKRHNFRRLCDFLQQQTQEWRRQQTLANAGVWTSPAVEILQDLRLVINRKCPEARSLIWNKTFYMWSSSVTSSTERSRIIDSLPSEGREVECHIDTLASQIKIKDFTNKSIAQFDNLWLMDRSSRTLPMSGISKVYYPSSESPWITRLDFLYETSECVLVEAPTYDLSVALADTLKSLVAHNRSSHFALLHCCAIMTQRHTIQYRTNIENCALSVKLEHSNKSFPLSCSQGVLTNQVSNENMRSEDQR
eukprot:Lankesteria_metandrocarpae@DN2612_c0_g1_i2.p1